MTQITAFPHFLELTRQIAYQNNPKFNKFISDNGLLFKAYEHFGKSEIEERTTLLMQLFRLIWNDDMFVQN